MTLWYILRIIINVIVLIVSKFSSSQLLSTFCPLRSSTSLRFCCFGCFMFDPSPDEPSDFYSKTAIRFYGPSL